MFKFTNIVMHYAPIGVAAAIAYTVGQGGFGVLYNLAWLVVTLYIALARPDRRRASCRLH